MPPTTSSPQKIGLFDSNRRPEDSAFPDELSDAQKRNRNFIFVSTMTEIEKSSTTWNGETGNVTTAMLMNSVNDFNL